MKVLLVVRSFINDAKIGRLKRDHGIGTAEFHRWQRRELQEDVRGFVELPTQWEEYEPTAHRPPLLDPTWKALTT